jgi:hypothetical protein
MARKTVTEATDRIRILERAVADIGEAQSKSGVETEESIRDILHELKALKLLLGRSLPDFKKQFLEIQRKVK